MLKVSAATVQYEGFKLGPITLDLPRGARVALVGRNGAGKTTLLGLLGGIVMPTSGFMEIAGRPIGVDPLVDVRQRVAYVGDARLSFPWMKVEEHFNFLAKIYPQWDMQSAVELARVLALPLADRTGTLSRGSTVKLNLCAAWGKSPRVLLLDEPTAGLDPVTRESWLGSLSMLLQARSDLTTIYATHLLDELPSVRPSVLLALTSGGLEVSSCVDATSSDLVSMATAMLTGMTQGEG